jgi:hypothetical protein
VGYGKWQVANGEWHMVVDLCEVKPGGCHEGERSEPMPELRLGRVVEQDFHRVIENSTNDKIGILSHGGTDAADRPGQSDCVRQSLPGGVKTPQKAPNEANSNRSKDHNRKSLSQKQPGRRGERGVASGQ